jgi:hypothetical protein
VITGIPLLFCEVSRPALGPTPGANDWLLSSSAEMKTSCSSTFTPLCELAHGVVFNALSLRATFSLLCATPTCTQTVEITEFMSINILSYSHCIYSIVSNFGQVIFVQKSVMSILDTSDETKCKEEVKFLTEVMARFGPSHIAQAVSRRLPTAASRVRSQVSWDLWCTK